MKMSVCTALVLLAAGTATACPASHPHDACGRCWASAEQARSAGCADAPQAPPAPTTGKPVAPARSTPPPPPPTPPTGASTRCTSTSHPYSACGQCWTSESQARSAGCTPDAQTPTTPAATPPAVPTPTAPTPPSTPRTGGRGKFEPASGRLLFVGQDTKSVDDYVAAFGKTPYGVTGYTSVGKLEGLTTVTNYGTGPQHLQYLATTYPQAALAVGVYLVDQLEGINSGELVDNLGELIDTLAGFDRQIFFRFGYEVDGPWNHYDPAEFRAAWRTAHRMVQEKGYGDRFAFVWQVASHCDGSFNRFPISAWWPGDAYVDWVGQSTFTQYDCDWGPNNAAVDFAREHNKPMMVAEAANQGYQNDELTHASPLSRGQGKRTMEAQAIWDAWYAPWFRWLEQTTSVKAVAYISADWDNQALWNHENDYSQGYWGDTRVHVNELIKGLWAAEVDKPSWRHA